MDSNSFPVYRKLPPTVTSRNSVILSVHHSQISWKKPLQPFLFTTRGRFTSEDQSCPETADIHTHTHTHVAHEHQWGWEDTVCWGCSFSDGTLCSLYMRNTKAAGLLGRVDACMHTRDLRRDLFSFKASKHTGPLWIRSTSAHLVRRQQCLYSHEIDGFLRNAVSRFVHWRGGQTKQTATSLCYCLLREQKVLMTSR